jgi:hypothetical protein
MTDSDFATLTFFGVLSLGLLIWACPTFEGDEDGLD